MPDGRIKYVVVTGDVSPGVDGRLRTLGTVQDITALRHAEQEKAKLEEQLHQAHKMESIGRLAGGIAHDFNNLLTVINGFSKLLMDQPDGQVRGYAGQIHKAGESAASLTRRLLTFSRKEVTHPEPVRLNAVVAEAREMLERLMGEHIEMRSNLKASPDEVIADPNQMQQCLMNLVLNARDAMPSGGELTIETSNVTLGKDDIPSGCSGAPGQYVSLTVRDTGVGMDEETRQRIFEPFFTTKEKGSGTGLGLSTVFGLVNQWHGFLSARSERGRGSEFSIHLPLSLNVSRPETAPAGKIAAPRPAIRKTVLVVEDQEIVRGFVVETLRSSGYSVLEAQSGADALEIIGQRGSEIDLLVTDVRMPGMGGKELARKAHAACPSICVLFMTGYADESINSMDVPGGTDEVILKPFTRESLSARVRGLLRHGEDSVVSAESPASGTAQ
jgi:signal transduction histidine kinase/ActR/RegA family two-component response regulator